MEPEEQPNTPPLIRKRVYLSEEVVYAITARMKENNTTFSIEIDNLLIELLIK